MTLHTIPVLQIPITIDPKQTILEEIDKGLFPPAKSEEKSGKNRIRPIVIVTPNPEIVMQAQSDPQLLDIIKRADVAIPDGTGVVWAVRRRAGKTILTNKNGEFARIPGIDFFLDLVAIAEKRSVPIGLIGGRPGVALKAMECLREQYPEILGWVHKLPELRTGMDGSLSAMHTDMDTLYKQIIHHIGEHRVTMIFVALGAPKQEYFIDQLRKKLAARSGRRVLLMTVGLSFDIISGLVPRAPAIFRTTGYEWLWRLIREPWRFWRQLALVRFVISVLRERGS